MKWISVNDSLPESNVLVLVYYAEFITKQDPEWEWREDGCRYVVAKFSSESGDWFYEGSDCEWEEIVTPTHWMPLPEPPKY